MSQHDMTINNQGFPDFRSDLNAALKALASINAGATAPSTTYANMLWADTSNNLLKIRNNGNTSWHILGPLDGHHAADTIRGRLTSSGDLQDLTVAQVKTLLDLGASGLLTALKTVDGASSGLDADQLDGQHGSYYRNAVNLNAGTVNVARLPTGTGADQLLKFDTAGKLPALNGEDLTNIPAPDQFVVSKLPDNRNGGGSYRSAGVIMRDRTLRIWGNNSYGQLSTGSGHIYTREAPNMVNFPVGITSEITKWVSSAYNHYVLFSNGDVWVWGRNNYGELGRGNTSVQYFPEMIEGDLENEVVTDVSVGWSSYNNACHVLFLTQSGKIYACGYNGNGQVGNGTTTNQSTPVQVGTATNWTKIFAIGSSYGYSAAINSNGDLYMWGYNGNGNLGQGDTTNRNTPTVVNGFGGADIDKFSACQDDGSQSGIQIGGFCGAVLTNGKVYTWGCNDYGQLGDSSNTQRTVPQEITALGTDNEDILCGGGHQGATYVKKTANEVHSSGYNGRGQLGRASTTDQNTFGEVGYSNYNTIEQMLYIGGVSYGSFFIRYANGRVKGCGYNGNGQLGIGTTTDRTDSMAYVRLHERLDAVDLCAVGGVSSECALGILTQTGQYLQTGYGGDGQNGDEDEQTICIPRLFRF